MDEFSWRYWHRTDASKFASLLDDPFAASKLDRRRLAEPLSDQPPQPNAPTGGNRSSPFLAIVRFKKKEHGVRTSVLTPCSLARSKASIASDPNPLACPAN